MKWSREDVNYLIRKYPTNLSLRDIYKNLKRSRRAVLHKAARLGLSRLVIPVNKPKDSQYRKKVDKKYYLKNRKKIYQRKQIRRKKLKEMAVILAGEKCQKCGYDKCIAALEFHHNTKDKESNIAELIKNSSEQNVLKEVNKCMLVCSNCHREIHAEGT